MSSSAVNLNSIPPELDRTEREAASLLEGLSDEQVNFRPNGQDWSIAQCLDHLARVNGLYTVALESAASTSHSRELTTDGAIRPGWFSRFFIRSMDAPPRRKFTAPPTAVPVSDKTCEQALAEFVASHNGIRRLLERGGNTEFNRVRFKNPFVPLLRFTVGSGILIILAHDRRHLWQAAQVRRTIVNS